MRHLLPLVWVGLALLVVAAAVRLRRRLGGRERGAPRLDDEAIRQIETAGRLAFDEEEPLDIEAIEEEERRFWAEEEWDSADEEF